MSTNGKTYRRAILKLSGEGLAAPEGFGIGTERLDQVAGEISEVCKAGVQLGVVVGGGNFLRGATLADRSMIPAATAHYMGMLATVMNGLALQEALETTGVEVRVLSSIPVRAVCEPFIRRRALRHLEKGRVVVLAGGTGRPFVTTDTAAALAAIELNADVVMKATQVDGVYSADPRKDPGAELLPELDYDRVIRDRLGVMDISAVDLCQRHQVPVLVFNLHQHNNLLKAARGERIGTIVH